MQFFTVSFFRKIGVFNRVIEVVEVIQWSTVSNAFRRSINTAPVINFLSKSNDMLMIFVKLGAIAEAECFSNLALIRSTPMALFVFNFLSSQNIRDSSTSLNSKQ